jgi:flavorubredoxin
MSEHAAPADPEETHVKSLGEDIDWVSRCHPNEEGVAVGSHTHISQYLVRTSEGNVLVDAGAGHGQELVGALREATGGEGLDTVLLTHAILPHTGNVEVLREGFSNPTFVSTSPIPPAIGVEDAQPTVINDTEVVEGDEFTFIDPLLTDVVVSTWIYHHDTKTMFTAEGVGHYHEDGDCARLSFDYADGIPKKGIHDFAADKLMFLNYVDPEKVRIAFETLLDEYDIERIAPIHGNPVEEDDIDGYIEKLVEVTGTF